MAPEVFEQKYGPKADIWSVGGVAFQMFTGQPPWRGMGITNPVALLMHLKNEEGPPEFPDPPAGKRGRAPNEQEMVDELQRLITQCFERDPSRRRSAQVMLGDPFFEEDDCSTVLSGTSSFAAMSPRTAPSARNSKVEVDASAIDGGQRTDVRPDQFITKNWPSWAREKAANSPSFKARLAVNEGKERPANPFGEIRK